MLPGLAVACPVGCWMTGVGAVEPGAALRGVVAEGVAGASVVTPGLPAQQEALLITLAAVQAHQNEQHCVCVRVRISNRLMMGVSSEGSCRVETA